MIFRSIVCLLFFVLVANGFSQEIPRIVTPYIQQFSKSVYKGGNQNWSIDVSPQGIIYAANTSGLMRYDGQQWHLYGQPKNALLRSVRATENKIYTGGLGEFGFWEDKGFGQLKYTSLVKLLEDPNTIQNDEIWRIMIDGDRVIFHSFGKAYLYENNQITILTADGEPFMFVHDVEDRIYFEKLHSGLHLYTNNQLVPIKEKDVLLGKNILCMLSLGTGKTLIGTSKDGIYLLNPKGEISVWQNEAQHLFQQYEINNGVKLNDRLFAFGTIQNGIFILNEKGELIQHINKNNGLQNNTVLSLSVDKQGNLWAGLDNGIDRIAINSPFYYYSDITGAIGTVYTSVIHHNQLYLGTNQGLFVSAWHGPNKYGILKFEQIQASSGQVWQLKVINGNLYCGHNNGTFQIIDKRLTTISSITGGWNIYPLSFSTHTLQGNYTGLSLFDNATKPIQHRLQYGDIKEPVKFIEEESEGKVWIGNNNGVRLLGFSSDMSKIVKIEEDIKGLPDTRFYGIYKIGNRNVFATDSGFYRYDEVIRSFVKYDDLNEQLGSFANANKIIRIREDHYWLIKKSHLAQIKLQSEGILKIDSTTWNPLKDRMMNEYENILHIDEKTDLIGLDNGFAIFLKNIIPSNSPGAPMITGFWNTVGEISLITDTEDISHSRNSVRIAFSLPWYSSTPLRFQYRLRGYDDRWTEWSETAFQDYTNLSAGDYTFEVRALTEQEKISDVTSLTFTILRPWYAGWLAIICYILFALILIYFIRQWYFRRIEQQKQALKNKMLEEQKIMLAKEAESNERKLMKLKNEKLEQELVIKNRELANAAMNIVYKNEVLNNLHEELKKLKDPNGNKLSSEQLKKVNNLIDEAHNDERDWNLFEKSFNETHENFFKKLKVDYPELVPNDLKMCAYLRLNMSSKEIASLLNITIRGVEIRRYRLRKKLNLETGENLTEFLMKL